MKTFQRTSLAGEKSDLCSRLCAFLSCHKSGIRALQKKISDLQLHYDFAFRFRVTVSRYDLGFAFRFRFRFRVTVSRFGFALRFQFRFRFRFRVSVSVSVSFRFRVTVSVSLPISPLSCFLFHLSNEMPTVFEGMASSADFSPGAGRFTEGVSTPQGYKAAGQDSSKS